jgi:Lipase (class 3)
MILFINGFEIMHWAKHEVSVRNKQCYDAVGNAGGIALIAGGVVSAATQGAGYGYCLTMSFDGNKQGNVYSPSRDASANAPYYQGKQLHYWDPVKELISKGFKDDKLFFINGSSDNRSTGQERYRIGQQIGQKMIENWTFIDSFNERFNQFGKKKQEVGAFKHFDTKTIQSVRNYYQLSADKLVQELVKRNPAFYMEERETIKLVGHSMGAAMAAGIAAVIAKHPIYGKKVEVVLYLAPHQPQDFVHPLGIAGYQSSSADDLVASKNEINIPVSAGNPNVIAMHNMFDSFFNGGKKQLPYTVDLPVSIAWAKGETAYQLIKNIPKQHFIQNKTHDGLASQRGHGVYTYDDEIEQFFKLYRTGK